MDAGLVDTDPRGETPDEPPYALGRLRSFCRAVGKILSLLDALATSDTPILLTGETGTGKQTLAWTVHALSRAKSASGLRCTGLAPDEFRARLEAALTKPGTLLLLDIGALAPASQADLMAALGAPATFTRGRLVATPAPRVLSTSSHDVAALVRQRRFRADLYFRLAGAVVEIPPLRRRPEDIVFLAGSFLRSLEGTKRLTFDALELLRGYSWPGNIRQLEEALKASARFAPGEEITHSALGHFLLPNPLADDIVVPLGSPLREAERLVIRATLAAHGGNRHTTAVALGISRRTLYEKLQNYRATGEAWDRTSAEPDTAELPHPAPTTA